jgi:hypothetical protein
MLFSWKFNLVIHIIVLFWLVIYHPYYQSIFYIGATGTPLDVSMGDSEGDVDGGVSFSLDGAGLSPSLDVDVGATDAPLLDGPMGKSKGDVDGRVSFALDVHHLHCIPVLERLQ